MFSRHTHSAARPASAPTRTSKAIRSLLVRFEWMKKVPRGAALFSEGEAPLGAYIIHRGRVAVSMTSQSGIRLELDVAGAGDIVGLSSAIHGQAFVERAEALSPCIVGFVRREDILRVLRGDTDAGFAFLEALSGEVLDSYDVLRDVAALKVRGGETHEPPPAVVTDVSH